MRTLTASQVSGIRLASTAPKQERAEALELISDQFSPRQLREVKRNIRAYWRKLDRACQARKSRQRIRRAQSYIRNVSEPKLWKSVRNDPVGEASPPSGTAGLNRRVRRAMRAARRAVK